MENEMRKFINRVNNFGKSLINEEKWASDGGYYTAPDRSVVISKEDANYINQAIEYFKLDIQDPEAVVKVDKSKMGQINWRIIQDLQKNWGIEFENDNEDFGINLFWLAPNQNIQDLNDGLEHAWQLFYDKKI